ncbi:MAG: class A beta-lactamase-related serine hydrolase [Actinomycetota bacterium]|nr:class A beta-lactamase-related serine hydrolase [Actinomycetota bacterium]
MQAWARRLALLPIGLAWLAVAPALAGASPGSISLTARPAHLRAGHRETLSGHVDGAPPNTSVKISARPYPYRHQIRLASVPVAADGSFSVVVHPDRNTRYQAQLTGNSTKATTQVRVTYRVITRVRALPLGRARVTILVFHPRGLRWNGARVRWEFSAGRRGGVRAYVTTRSRRLGPHITLLRAVVALPAGRFGFRSCFRAPQDHALANPARPRRCTGRGYKGAGRLPAGFPGARAVQRAARFLARRAGRTAFAIVDSEGRLSGVNVHRRFITASVVKAMLLVAYLRRLDAHGQRRVDPGSQSFLYPMIHVSDNSAATRCWSIVSDSGLYAVARAAHMTDFTVSGGWGNAEISPADQAGFFFAMDALVPREFRGYARFLLSTIVDYESWGIPAVARPRGYRVFFKGGWRGTGLGRLVHQVARLQGRRGTFSLAVMTDGDPSMGYGIDTIAGVTAALLR